MTKSADIKPLKKRAEYLEVAATGKKWVEKGLIVQFLPPAFDSGPMRVGLTVSGRTGNAVLDKFLDCIEYVHPRAECGQTTRHVVADPAGFEVHLSDSR